MGVGRGFNFFDMMRQRGICLCAVQAQWLMGKCGSFQKTEAWEDTGQSKSLYVLLLKMAFLQQNPYLLFVPFFAYTALTISVSR